MLVKSRGIVLNFIKFKETSIIARIYTENYGIQSMLINGIRSRKSLTSVALFQPLTFLDLVFFFKEEKTIRRIQEVKCSIPFQSVPFDIRKSCMALFISEVLTKVLKEETADQTLFSFIFSGIIYLDQEDYQPDFHIWFLIHLSFHLGFGPENATDIVHESNDYLGLIDRLIQSEPYTAVFNSNIQRKRALEYIVNFYSRNIGSFGELRSLKVLDELFAG